MTPERIEEIKQTADDSWFAADNSRGAEAHLRGEVFALCEGTNELLAALEESQQDIECFRSKTAPESLGYGAKWKEKALAARAELVEAKRTISRIQDERFQLERSNADAQSEVWRLERELRWYADEINWNQGDWEGGIFYTLADRDGGKRAQAALSNNEGSDKS